MVSCTACVQGPPLALAAANGMLVSGGQDAAVRWWRFDESSAQFQPLVSCTGGCTAPLSAVSMSLQRLADMVSWCRATRRCRAQAAGACVRDGRLRWASRAVGTRMQ